MLALGAAACGEAYAQPFARCEPPAGQLVSVQGSIELRPAGQTQWQPAQSDDVLCAGDMIRMGERSRGAIAFPNDTFLRLDQKTTVTLVAAEEAQPSLLELCRGVIHFMTRTRKSLRVITPFVNASVEGTEFSIEHTDADDRINVFEGRVAVTNEAARPLPQTCDVSPAQAAQAGTLLLESGEAGLVPRDRAPFKLAQVVVRPEDAVQWALYYPPLAAAQAPGELTSRVHELLALGRVEEAKAEIQKVLDVDPSGSAGYALQSIIALVQNDKAEALKLAQRAIQLNEKSAEARIALSYAQQAHFQIEEALASVRKTVELEPDNALAWARIAELELSLGRLDEALEAAQKAVALDPNIARTQTVLGFANLTRIDADPAKSAFEKAIELDQADPLPRLGLGLAKIRESNLEAGRREIEIAASLDPADSLIRSYLGKAYFEERRDKLAGIQFDIAKELDPLDPTPWFYDAIRKQTENQPVEALEDLEKAIDLNDNRAVYRSGLLLDEDRAARGASLARIYDDLGFEQLAMLEASESLARDPANHSAHRFLSDAYARRERHEIARVSELLQSQLLQPVNINPVQPRLAFTDLGIVTSTGLSDAAFNEYTRLFERDRARLTVTGVAGNNDTLGDEAVVSGINGRFSYSLGQFHYQSDGFRENNDIEHDIYNVFAQFAVTPELNVQGEVRRRDSVQGDLSLRGDPDRFDPRLGREVEQEATRLGVYWAPSPREDLLFSAFRFDAEELRVSDREAPTMFNSRLAEEDGYQAEVQYIRRGDYFDFVTGAGHYSSEVEQNSEGILSSFERDRANGYLYTYVDAPRTLLWTVGASRESNEQVNFDIDRWNKKLGLQWSPTTRIRFRLAAFDTVKPALFVQQTVEPTQVAGFNQFFDDFNGTIAENYAAGVDIALSAHADIGFEMHRRELEVPVGISREPEVQEFRRSYIYWTAYEHWVLSADYRSEYTESTAITTPFSKRSTKTVPLAARYFVERFFSEIKATHVHQRVQSLQFPGGDDFWVLDAVLGYRLPNRFGFLSLEARNLTDNHFQFLDNNAFSPEINSPRFIPERAYLLRITLQF
jgi:tetratricopeptide (TPR) repeat protein